MQLITITHIKKDRETKNIIMYHSSMQTGRDTITQERPELQSKI